MKENDNLEKFFRKSLEDFSAEPSNDMWDRIAPVIPPKPPVWVAWASASKWLGGLLVLSTLAIGIYYFMDSQRQVEVLREMVTSQAEVIEQLEAKMLEKGEEVKGENVSMDKSSDEEIASNSSVNQVERNKEFRSNKTIITTQHAIENTTQKNSDLLYTEKSIIEAPIAQKNLNVQHSNFSQLNTLPISLFENQITANPKEVKVKKTINPYPQFSFEGRGGFFTHNIQKIIFADSSKTNNPFASWQAGLLVNFELSPRWLIQTGFLFKNFKAVDTQIRYNAFPIMAQYRFGFKDLILNAKSGIILNTLIDAKSGNERVVIPNLESNFIDFSVGLGMDFKLNSSTKLCIEPWTSYSLNPAANSKKVFQFGVNLGAQYSIQ